MTNEDLIRELEKVSATVKSADNYFHHQTKMNANLHMANPLPSPLAAAMDRASTSLVLLIGRLKKENLNGTTEQP